MSIITPEALERCAQEAAHREHLQALRASKRINDHYDQLLKGEEPEQLGRGLFDRRSADIRPARRIERRPVADMRDVDLHLSAP